MTFLHKFKKTLKKGARSELKSPSKRPLFNLGTFRIKSSLSKLSHRSFSKTERYALLFLFILIIIGTAFYFRGQYKHTELLPTYGGEYVEGTLGQPKYINPILCQTNDVDMGLSKLVFSSLFTYDKQLKLIPELVEKYEISKNQKTYTLHLKHGVKWHDGEKLDASDVIFTVQAIQNLEYKSPLYLSFKGVKIDKIDPYTIKFTLEEPYSPFLSSLTFGILPNHIWNLIESTSASLCELNLRPVGSGPFQFKELKKDKGGNIKSLTLKRFDQYFLNSPYLEKTTFNFYQDHQEILEALAQKDIQGISRIMPENKDEIERMNLNCYQIQIPRYYAVFFNQNKSSLFKDRSVRVALEYATNKDKIVEDVLSGLGKPCYSPILSGMLGYVENPQGYNFDPEKAKNILAKAGWIDKDRDGIREKSKQKLEFSLVTTDWPEYKKTAELLKELWGRVGIKVNLISEDVAKVTQEYIKPRNYQALLYGEALGGDPDSYSFWHSSQLKDPGLNLSSLESTKIDELLESARKTTDTKTRVEKYKAFQKELTYIVPAIFLYSPTYLYGVDKEIKGIDLGKVSLPCERFNGVNKWYIEMKRVKK